MSEENYDPIDTQGELDELCAELHWGPHYQYAPCPCLSPITGVFRRHGRVVAVLCKRGRHETEAASALVPEHWSRHRFFPLQYDDSPEAPFTLEEAIAKMYELDRMTPRELAEMRKEAALADQAALRGIESAARALCGAP